MAVLSPDQADVLIQIEYLEGKSSLPKLEYQFQMVM